MPFTPGFGWPYPDPNDPPQHSADFQDLAEAVEDTVEGQAADIATLQADLTALEAQALVVLDEIVETSPVSAIEFVDIPQDYQHLLVYWRGDGEAGTQYSSMNVRFNGDDSAAAYSSQRVSFASLSGTWTQELVFGGGPFFSTLRVGMVGSQLGSLGHYFVPFYSSSATTKSAVGSSVAIRQTGGQDFPTAAMGGGKWVSSTDAITSLWMSPSGNQWDRVRVHLIGIRSGT